MLIETHKTRTEFHPPSSTLSHRAKRLTPQYWAKPWGRDDGIPAPSDAQPLGEMIFDAAKTGLVVKWLQTNEPLPIQVHPQRGAGRKHGWWYVADTPPRRLTPIAAQPSLQSCLSPMISAGSGCGL